METKYTPGPWKIDEATDNAITIVAPWSSVVRPENTMLFGDYRGGHVCSMQYNSGVPTKEQAMANAKLISAAPELANACYAVLQSWHAKMSNMHKQEPYYLQQIRDALVKAGR